MGKVGCGAWDLSFPPGPPDRVADMFTAAVVADAVRRFDADLAQSVETCRDWRRGYRGVFRGVTALAVSAPAVSLGIAEEGLASLRTMLRFAAGRRVTTLRSVNVAAEADDTDLATGRIDGEAEPVRRLEVPYRGEVLAEERLRRQLADWRRDGIVEPGFAAAVERVVDHPEWLSLPGFRLTVVGASAHLAPLRPLLSWGAEVLAVDRPGRFRWDRLHALARARAGSLRFPLTESGPGADLTKHFPTLVRWILAHADARPVLGLYASNPGAAGVRLSAAADVLAEAVRHARPDTALAYLGASTDCYAVPPAVLAAAREHSTGRGVRGTVQDALRRVTPWPVYHPNYPEPVRAADGEEWGLFDNLPTILGPDYAVAQRLPRWRAVLTRAAGGTVSYTVAPPAWPTDIREATLRPITLRGIDHYGIEVFEPSTARTLLAAKLVADLFDPPPNPDPNPEALFTTGAAHGGLWRQPFQPSSLLAPSTLLGCLDAVRDFGERHLRPR
ncbi:hypothetical protein [Nocardia otitidiscaviarum]|uniref:hypothetical protein n=1 Tax=Nocardia otitidiscaviarum TaxID=1823 RepID=UPI0018942F66|nr:hypothetical protein [Nocardia otitidiscaviarum]MBF6182948.1 hypothetical protein [Nocardia otitidiscaviarum]